MSEALVLPFPKRARTHLPVRHSTRAPAASLPLNSVDAVEIITPDGYCAALLQDFAAPIFSAEIVAGSCWIVRFYRPPGGSDWVVELLSLIERWLASAPLTCTKASLNAHKPHHNRVRLLYPPPEPTQAA